MKFFAVALVTTLLSAEAFSQVRPGRGHYDNGRGNYENGRGNYDNGRGNYDNGRGGRYGRTTPNNARTFSCYGADLFRNNRRLIHRFDHQTGCRIALNQIVNSRTFCDNSDLFDIRGNFIKSYRNRAFCFARATLLK